MSEPQISRLDSRNLRAWGRRQCSYIVCSEGHSSTLLVANEPFFRPNLIIRFKDYGRLVIFDRILRDSVGLPRSPRSSVGLQKCTVTVTRFSGV